MSTDAARAPTRPADPAGGIWAPARRPLTVGLVLAVTFVAIVAAAAARIGHGPGVALAFSFGIAIALTGAIVGARLPSQLTRSAADHSH